MEITHKTTAEPAPEPELKLNYMQKIWRYRRYMVIELSFFFYLMANILNDVAIKNLPLEKACRVNLGYNKATCMAMLDKAELGIDCDSYEFENTHDCAWMDQTLLDVDLTGLNYTVCEADCKVQQLFADVSGKRAPIAAIFTLIIMLFAGGWADKFNKRKPCMIIPIVGEAVSFICLIISAIFFDSLPMEFGMYLEAIVPAVCGGQTLCVMAMYSYMTIATPEEDRVSRFGIFIMFLNGLPLLGVFSGYLLNVLGYIISFASAVVFKIIAILCIMLFLKEIKPKPTISEETPDNQLKGHAADNMAFEQTTLDELPVSKNVNFQLTPRLEPPKVEPPPVPAVKPSLLKELFDPTLAKECLRYPFIKRKNHGRLILNLLVLATFLIVGPSFAESDFVYPFTIKKLNWNGTVLSVFNTINGLLAILGTYIGTAILSKRLKFSDASLAIFSSLGIVCSRPILAFANNTTWFYVGCAVDMFALLRAIATKTISSSIVEGDELSKMYSIFGIIEPITQFLFPPIYSMIYRNTVESFPGAFFLFGEIFYVPNVLVFVLCYFLLRHRKSKEQKNSVELAQNKEGNGQADAADGTEITSL
ncbi:PREDICTED: uncharacterized protein LOC108621692 [Drosophila arizonae]|uniref:Uncharacterized protein LOC108621692 n=1 Tax=Drosophila arizonae TaxID=7263 RepID=A0ABM1Q5A6_DROAR|nr:PREDICTED: uncharacterized protein LOC108621692 [Drosophila arizonae]